jgi:opacity protein-like surface antigen
MGGAYEALGYGAEAIGGNPAAISLFKRYTIEAAGTWDVPHGDGNFTLGVLDATSSVAAGLSYHYVTYGGADSRRFAHVTTLALSVPILSMIHLGVAGRHQVLLGATSTNSVTVNAGLVFRPADWLSLGFSGHNLIGVASVDVRRYVVASVSSLLFGQLTPAFDLRMDFNQPSTRFAYLGGVEWLIGNTFPVRGGYEYDGIADGLGRRQYVSFGLGYFSNGSGLDVAYRHELGGAEGRVLAVSLKLQVN